MSATAATPQELEEFTARLRRMNAETEKFVAEQRKLIAESEKLNRDRFLAPWLAIAGAVGGIVAITSLVLRATGATP
jgi:hypothetical protein